MAVIDRLAAGLERQYRIERELGAGGMAIVFLARDLRHDRLVALKLLRPELSAILGGEEATGRRADGQTGRREDGQASRR